MSGTYQRLTAEQWAEKYRQLDAQINQDLANIHAKQQRDRERQVIEFAVANELGEVGESTTDYETAAMVADVTDCHVVTRTVTPWQRVNTTTEIIEGN